VESDEAQRSNDVVEPPPRPTLSRVGKAIVGAVVCAFLASGVTRTRIVEVCVACGSTFRESSVAFGTTRWNLGLWSERQVVASRVREALFEPGHEHAWSHSQSVESRLFFDDTCGQGASSRSEFRQLYEGNERFRQFLKSRLNSQALSLDDVRAASLDPRPTMDPLVPLFKERRESGRQIAISLLDEFQRSLR
jgi:hypothetical protein